MKTSIVDAINSAQADIDDAKAGLGALVPTNLVSGTYTRNKYVRFNNGDIITATNVSDATDYIDVSGCESIVYSRIYSTSTSAQYGIAFYDESKTYVSGVRCVLNQTEMHYVMSKTEVPENAKYVRLTEMQALGAVSVYNADDYDTKMSVRLENAETEIDALQSEMEEFEPVVSSVEALSAKVDTAVRVLGVESDYLFEDTWARKTIGNGSSGIGTTGKKYESSTKRLATYGVQDCSGLDTITFEPESGYKWELFLFDEELTSVLYDSGWTETDATCEVPANAKYCAVLIANTDNTTINLSEYVNVKIKGRVTGSRLANIEEQLDSMSLGYEKSEVFDDFSAEFNVDGDVSSFIFFTDPHIYNANVMEKDTNKLFTDLKTAYNSTPTEFIMCGGDWLQGGADDVIPSGPTQAQACSQLGFVDGVMHKLFSDYKPIFGNHDSNYKNTALAQKTINNLMFKEQGESYYDFLSGNTRYYVLDSGLDNNTGSLTTRRKEQILWLADKLRTNTDAHVVICMHIFYSTTSSDWHNATITAMGTAISQLSSAYNAKGTYTTSWDSSLTYDFSAVTGKIHYIIAGHLHGDWIVQHYGVTAVMTTKALYDWTTPTFDLCLNDYVNNILCMLRVGDGANRYCHTDNVAVSTTETLAASKITPTAWESDDTSVATVSDGVVTKVATGYSLITAEDASGNLETWIVDCN